MGGLTLLENVVILVIIEEKMVMSITVMMFYVLIMYNENSGDNNICENKTI